MADREKVIEHLKEIAEYFRGCRSNASFASKAENHFWELQNAASEAAELLKAQEPGWISVKDRLPERAGKYLVVSKTALAELPPHVKTAWFLNNKRDNYQFEYEGEPNEPGFYNGDGEGDWVERYVTHWLPLPEPPKEET